MTTQYTPILKLALPVTGELSGSWGDTVNDNITSMVEQAVAGLATINTWTANVHTLTTANGTTSESRCAMLVTADGAGGTALTAAGEIICPAASKLYVLKNGSSYAITLKTSAGTGIAVPVGQTAFLFCDSTNVNACVTTIVNGNISGNLTVDGDATINGNTTLGNATSDTITATARFNTDLLPSTDNARDLGSSGNSWKDVYIDGTAYLALVDINGGTIDGVSIGATTAATIVNVDNLRLDGNTLSSTDTNGNVVVAPNGTGDVQLDADTVRIGDSGATATLTTNGAGNLVLSTNSGTTSGTVTIANGANGNIVIAPNGTGDVQLDADTIRIGDLNTAASLTTNGTGNLNLTTNGGTNSGTIQIAQGVNGAITLTPNGTGVVSVPTVEVTGGTVNGVAFLNASKTLTTGSALTYNAGTNTLTAGTFSGALSGNATNVTGIVAAVNGGTGQSSYAVGDLLYASTSTAIAKLADVATGNALISGGVGVAPSWGKVGLTTHVSGTLPVANGGTGITSLGTGVATFLQTPSSANLAAAVTDETGTGALVFATSPTLVTPALGTPSSGVVTNLTGTASININGTVGATTPNTGAFTTLSSTGNTTLGDASADTVTINGTVQPGVVISGSSAGDALRITQTGAGNALVVEDSTNPDSSPVVVDSSGQLIVGYTAAITTSAGAPRIQASGGVPFSGVIYGDNATNGVLQLGKSRGTTTGVNTTVQNGDSLFEVRFEGADGTGFVRAAAIGASVDGTPGTNDMPGRLVFSTTADGAATPTERVRISANGLSTFGSQAATGAALSTTAPAKVYTGTGTYTDSSTAASGTVTHGTINAVDNPAIAATNASVTYTNASTLYIDGAPTAGTNVTITNPYSLFVNAGTVWFGGNVTGTDPVVQQSDIGSGPNEIPLNQYLGNLAYQDAANIAGPVGVGGALTVVGATTLAATTIASATVTGAVSSGGGVVAEQLVVDSFTASSSTVLRGGATNLLPYSEQFDNAAWAKGDISITANTVVAPDGTLTADKLVENTSNANHVAVQSFSFVSGTTYTLSVYAKAAERTSVRLSLPSAVTTDAIAAFNLTTGVVPSTGTGVTTASVTSVGGGWFRCAITVTATNSATGGATIWILNPSSPYTGDGTSGLFIWGAQLEAASTAGPYLKTIANAVTTAYAAPLESPNGLAFPLLATMTPARNSDMTVELASNTSLVIKVRGSDGVVRSTTLTLA